MKQLFISYTRKDEPFVQKLAAALEGCGVSLWYDRKGIGAGSQWEAELLNALNKVDLLLLILTPESLQSVWVKREWELALKQSKPIFPILYTPLVQPLPPELAGIQHLDFNKFPTFEAFVNAVLDELRAFGFRPSRDYVNSTAIEPTPPINWTKWAVIWAVVVGLLTVLATVAAPYISHLLENEPTPTAIAAVSPSPSATMAAPENPISTVSPTSIAATDSASPTSTPIDESRPLITVLFEGVDSLTLVLHNPSALQDVLIRTASFEEDVFATFNLDNYLPNLTANTCLRYVRNNTQTPLPQLCDPSRTFEQEFSAVDIFWHDDSSNRPEDLVVEVTPADGGASLKQICSSANQRCQIFSK